MEVHASTPAVSPAPGRVPKMMLSRPARVALFAGTYGVATVIAYPIAYPREVWPNGFLLCQFSTLLFPSQLGGLILHFSGYGMGGSLGLFLAVAVLAYLGYLGLTVSAALAANRPVFLAFYFVFVVLLIINIGGRAYPLLVGAPA